MKTFDYQIVTSNNQWVGGGINSTQEDINKDVLNIKERLISEGFEGEIIILKAEKMIQTTIKI
jgi:hypothetical protein